MVFITGSDLFLLHGLLTLALLGLLRRGPSGPFLALVAGSFLTLMLGCVSGWKRAVHALQYRTLKCLA